MKKIISIIILIFISTGTVFSMCSPAGYTSLVTALCNGPVLVQDGACVNGTNVGLLGTADIGCLDECNEQDFFTFTATTTVISIDLTSTGISTADIALVTTGGGCADHVSDCPTLSSYCLQNCFTSTGTNPLSADFSGLVVGETYTIIVESAPANSGTFNICVVTDFCNDGIQNNGEAGVDCGGICSNCPLGNDACASSFSMTVDDTTSNASSTYTNTCTQTLCSDPATEDCYIAACPPGPPSCGCVYSYMSCGSVENNSWYTFTPATTGDYFFTLFNQTCANNQGMQMWIGTQPSGCGDASTYNELYCQSTATTADIQQILTLTAGVTYTITLDGFAGDDCDFDFGVFSTSILPVQLVDFVGTYLTEKKSVSINWRTATELSNDYFTIERSRDANVYEVIDVVLGSGVSNTISNYKLEDKEPFNGINYYRLKQTDYDGRSEYLGVTAVNVSNAGDINLFPTVTTTNVNLDIFFALPTYTNILVYNAVGKLVFEEKIELGRGKSSYVIPSEGFDSGVYFVKVNSLNSNNSQSLKFIKN